MGSTIEDLKKGIERLISDMGYDSTIIGTPADKDQTRLSIELEQCKDALEHIKDNLPSGDYALEASLQTAITKLNEIKDAIPSTSGLALEATLQLLLTCCNAKGTEATLQAIQGSIPSTSGLALDATLQSLLSCCNARGTEATLQAIQGAIPSTSGLALEATLQLLLTCCEQRGTEATLQAIAAALPDLQDSLEDLEICCTNQALRLDQIEANTDHLDQMSTDLTQIEADVAAQAANIATMKTDVAAIRDCACRSPLRQMMEECCRTEVEEDGEKKKRSVRDAEEGVDFHEDDPAYDPPDGSADWATYKSGKCLYARWFVWQSGRDYEDLITMYQTIGDSAFNLLSSNSAIAAVMSGAAAVSATIAATRTAVLLAKGAASSTAVGFIAVLVFEALINLWKLAIDLFLDDIMSIWNGIPKCELVSAIYCGKTGQEIKDNWDAVFEEHVPAVPYLPLRVAFQSWVSLDVANSLCIGPGVVVEVPPVLTECSCDCMGNWHDPDLAVHTHDDLRSMTLSGNVITQWTNTGAAGGYFAPTGSPVFDSGYVTIAPGKKLAWTGGSWGDGRFFALYVVCEFTGTMGNSYLLGQDGQDHTKPIIIRRSASVVELALVGGDQKNITTPTGRCLIGMRRESGLTNFSLNGTSLGTLVGGGSPGVYPPLYLGTPTQASSTNGRIWAVVGWLRPTELTQAQEDDIINNLTALYGPFGV